MHSKKNFNSHEDINLKFIYAAALAEYFILKIYLPHSLQVMNWRLVPCLFAESVYLQGELNLVSLKSITIKVCKINYSE